MRPNHHTRAGSGRPNLERHGVPMQATAVPAGLHVVVLAARFHAAVVDRLVDGALEALIAAGLTPAQLRVVPVPGAWELPLAAELAISEGCDAIVALGCVIRGETSHYDVIVNESARGLMDVGLKHRVPIANGVLACENEEQAWARAGGAQGNKGAEAAQAALAMAGLKNAARPAAELA